MAQTNAATITTAQGSINVERAGQTLSLKQGDSVQPGDILHTESSPVKITFADGATALLSPKSSMIVQEFSFGGGKEPSFVVKLVEGVMRSVSGAVVEQNPDAFKVLTPKATVGIRGTIFISKVNPDGSEVTIVIELDQGHVVTVTNHHGEILTLTRAGQATFVSSNDSEEMEERALTELQIREILGPELSRIILDEVLSNAHEKENSSEVVQDLIERLQEKFGAEAESAGQDVNIVLNASLESEAQEESDEDEVIIQSEAPILGENEEDESEALNSNPGPYPAVISIDGSQSFYADKVIINTAITQTLIHHNITITHDMWPNVVVSGDVKELSAGTVTGGNDTITGVAMSNGRIVGDAETVSGTATLMAGQDSITLDAKTGGHSVYGDIYEALDASTVSFHDDIISINGDFFNSIIAGDAHMIENTVTVNRWGNDTINVGANMGGTAVIYGDYSVNPGMGGGNDAIDVGSMQDTAQIYGGAGADSISVGNMQDTAQIHGGTGADNISVTTLSSGTVNGDEDNDTINISNAGGGTINGGAGADSITLSAQSGNVTVDGGADDDRLFFETLITGTVNLNNSGGTDTVSIANGLNGTASVLINSNDFVFQDGAGSAFVLNAGTMTLGTAVTNFSGITHINGGTLNGSGGDDSITVATLSSGTINGNDGDDTIRVTAGSGGNINGGAGDDYFYVGGAGAGSVAVDGGSGTNTLNYETVTGQVSIGNATNIDNFVFENINGANAELNGTAGNDSISVGNLILGQVNGLAGDDSITVTTLSSGTINGDDGNDTINIDNAGGGTINGGAGADSITLSAQSGNVTVDGGTDDDRLIFETLINDTITLNNSGGTDTVSIANGISGTASVLINSNDFVFQDGANNAFVLDAGTMTLGATATNFSGITHINGGILNGSGGDDSIVVNTLSGGSLNGGEGDDSIVVNTLSGGTLNGGAGSDTIHVTNSAGTGSITGSINGGAGDDHFYVTDLGQGYASVDGGAGIDTLHFENITGSVTIGGGVSIENYAFGDVNGAGAVLSGTNGVDNITIDNIIQGTVNGLEDDDVIEVLTAMSGGTINGNDGADSITVAAMTNGTIDGGAGADTITLSTTPTGGSIENSGTEQDTLYITADLSSNLSLTSAGGGFSVQKNATEGITMTGGTLTGSAGADSILVQSISGGTIDGGTGADTITLSNTPTGGSIENSGTEQDTLYLTSDVNSNLSLTSAGGGFAVQKNATEGITMTGGTLMGSAGADSILVQSISGGTIIGGDGIDTISFVNAVQGGTIDNLATDADILRFSQGIAQGETLTLQSGNFTLQDASGNDFALNSGTIKIGFAGGISQLNLASIGNGGTLEGYQQDPGQGSSNDLQLTNTTMSGGTIQGSDYVDSISIGTMTGGMIYTGAGADTVSYEAQVTNLAHLNITNAGDTDTVFLSNGIDGGEVNLSGTSGFIVGASAAGSGQVNGFTMSSGTLNGSDGIDYIVMSDMRNGTIDLNGGNDTVGITGTMSNGTLNGGAGNDYFSIATYDGGSIDGGAGRDTIAISNALTQATTFTNNDTEQDILNLNADVNTNISLSGTGGGFTVQKSAASGITITSGMLTGSGGADSIWVNSMGSSASTIDGGAGADTITLTNIPTGGSISNGGAERDTLYLKADVDNNYFLALTSTTGGFAVQKDATEGITMTNGILTGSDGADSIWVDTMSGGTINGGAGVDTITLTNIPTAGSIENSGTERDTLYINSDMDGTVTLISATGSFMVQKNATEGITMTNGILTGSDGADSIWVDSLSRGTIDGGGGADTIRFENAVQGGSIVNTDADTDILMFSQGIAQGKTLTLLNDNFNLQDGSGNDFTLNSGTIEIGFVGGINQLDLAFIGTGGTLKGYQQDPGSGGANVLELANTTVSGGTIQGSDFDDNISIKSMTGGTINSGNGADGITVYEMTGGTINSGEGNDTIIHDRGNDYTGSSHHFNVVNSEGHDTVYITGTAISGGTVTLSGDGAFTVSREQGVSLDIAAGTLTTGNGSDSIAINTMGSGMINSGAGNDTISYEANIVDGSHFNIHNSADTDTVFITDFNGLQGGEVNLSGSGGFIVAKANSSQAGYTGFTMGGGILNGSEGHDSIYIATMNDGTVDLNAGANSINISEVGTSLGAMLDVRDGNNAISISTTNTTVAGHLTIRGFDFGKNDTLTIAGTAYTATSDGDDIPGMSAANLEDAIANNESITIGSLTIQFTGGSGGGSTSLEYGGDDLYADTTASAVTLPNNTTYLDHDIDISVTIPAGNILSGDVHIITGNVKVWAGDDTITGNTITVLGTISGDAIEVNGTIDFNAGDDSININTLTGENARIYGDAQSIGENVTFSEGNDTIIVTNLTNGAKIYGDVGNMDDGEDGTIGGADVIGVTTMHSMDQDTFIYGGADNDTITVGDVTSTNSANYIEGGGGHDSIAVTNMMINQAKGSAFIRGENGNDTITVTNMDSSDDIETTIQGGAGEDSITVTSFDGKKSFIEGGEDNDRITVTVTNTDSNSDNAPTIDPGEGNDTLILSSPGAGAGGSYYVNVKKEDLNANDTLEINGTVYTGNFTSSTTVDNGSTSLTVHFT